MSNNLPMTDTQWSLPVHFALLDEHQSGASINLLAGINTFVGPNGSGKTRVLRHAKSALERDERITFGSRKVHFMAAGRSSPFETYRSAVHHPNGMETTDAAVGDASYRRNWWQFESLTGALLALDARADLRLKIEARLQQLFDRSVRLSWSQRGLEVRIAPAGGGAAYAANHEASGILHLVALLAAIHSDEIGALIIDEPEISLHPQHQAFLLEEMERVAGHPADPTRKVIVMATHSTVLLPLRAVNELPAITFFNSVRTAPTQVSPDAEILNRTKLTAFISRLSATHRLAMFAERVLLVEGPSDEIVAAQLARRLDLRLLARNAQIVPVTGKGEFIEAAKLFRMMNKEVAILADLDAMADGSGLVRSISDLPAASAVADRIGRSTISELDRDLRSDFARFIEKHSEAVRAAADQYPDWSAAGANEDKLRRVTLARVLTDPFSFGNAAIDDAASLQARYQVLMRALAELGCFFLHRGAIENYYLPGKTDVGKPNLAAEEAASFKTTEDAELLARYREVVAALVHIAPNQRVDEDLLLRPKLGAVLASAFLSMRPDTSDDQLNSIAAGTVGSDAGVFRLTNRSTGELKIAVEIASPLFQRATFPFEIRREENMTLVIPEKLPGLDGQ